MKNPIKLTVLAATLGLGLLSVTSSQAEVISTTKGERLAVTGESTQGTRLSTLADFKSLRKGDKMSVYCPMMKSTTVTTIRNADSKGHVKITETGEGYAVGGCNVILKKQSDKQVKSVMVCPDGSVQPVECVKL